MNAEEAARKIYPPEDGAVRGVDRNEQARHAFLRGVEWEKRDYEANMVDPDEYNPEAGSRMHEPIGTPITAEAADQAMLYAAQRAYNMAHEGGLLAVYKSAYANALRQQIEQIEALKNEIREIKQGRQRWPHGQEQS